MLTRSELEETMNVIGCTFFPLTTLMKSIEIKKDNKITKFNRKDFIKALHEFNSNPRTQIRFEFIDDLFIRANSFAFDLLYLR